MKLWNRPKGLFGAFFLLCSFLAGRLVRVMKSLAQSPDRGQEVDMHHPWVSSVVRTDPLLDDSTTLADLTRQQQDQLVFQELLAAHQFPSNCNDPSVKHKFWIRGAIPPKDGFASEFQYMARLLQSAVSTQRILQVKNDWQSAYCPDDPTSMGASGQGWTCLWQPLSNCFSFVKKQRGHKSNNGTDLALQKSILHPMGYGILPNKLRSDNVSLWFTPLVYGSQPILPASISFPFKHSSVVIDVIPHWERAYGRYWIKSQMAHFLWKPAPWLEAAIRPRLFYPTDRPFVGIHVRYTDNIPDFAKAFGRNATQTRQLERYWQVAQERIVAHRKRNQLPPIRDIYVATDHELVIAWTQRLFVGWTVWSQTGFVQRATTQQRIWFAQGRSTAAAAMAADLEGLRRADYLIGSFQSNVYRLAAQLNTAYHVSNYSVHEDRHFAVDVEWFEDP
eukprot:Nitzschia sp. Nitz4//scaffold352_size16485//14344//15684//NITZ4_008860-RA/size16485-processed-gene-0.8-mRNA-1//1//CDS//3329548909//7466//frame0